MTLRASSLLLPGRNLIWILVGTKAPGCDGNQQAWVSRWWLCLSRTCRCDTETQWSFLPLHVEQLVLATACGGSLGWMFWLEMANSGSPPSPWLSLYIKITHIQPHGFVFSRLVPQLLNLFISHILSFLTHVFFILHNFLVLPYSWPWACSFASHRTHSFLLLSQESTSDFTHLRQPIGAGWEDTGRQQNKVKANL